MSRTGSAFRTLSTVPKSLRLDYKKGFSTGFAPIGPWTSWANVKAPILRDPLFAAKLIYDLADDDTDDDDDLADDDDVDDEAQVEVDRSSKISLFSHLTFFRSERFSPFSLQVVLKRQKPPFDKTISIWQSGNLTTWQSGNRSSRITSFFVALALPLASTRWARSTFSSRLVGYENEYLRSEIQLKPALILQSSQLFEPQV